MSDEIFFAAVAFPQGAVDNNLQQFLLTTFVIDTWNNSKDKVTCSMPHNFNQLQYLSCDCDSERQRQAKKEK